MSVDFFLRLGDIKGESVDHKHKDEIDVLSWSWGMSQAGTTHAGRGGGAGKVHVDDINLTKYVDKATPALMLHCCSGKHIKDAVLTLRKAGDKPLEYVKVTMTDILVANVNTGGGSGEERLTENVTLNFGKVKFEYVPQKADGSGAAAIEAAWNIAENKPE